MSLLTIFIIVTIPKQMLRIQNTKDYLNEHTLVVQIYVLVQRMQVWYLASLLQISAGGVLRWWD